MCTTFVCMFGVAKKGTHNRDNSVDMKLLQLPRELILNVIYQYLDFSFTEDTFGFTWSFEAFVYKSFQVDEKQFRILETHL